MEDLPTCAPGAAPGSKMTDTVPTFLELSLHVGETVK